MPFASITGWGACMPPAVLTNEDLSTFLDTNDEWITSRTGMKERRVSHVTAVELSTVAAARALACAGLDPADVDLIIYGGVSNEELCPNSASGVQLALGATKKTVARTIDVERLPIRMVGLARLISRTSNSLCTMSPWSSIPTSTYVFHAINSR